MDLVGCAVRTMEHGSVRTAHPTEHNCPACRVYHGGITEQKGWGARCPNETTMNINKKASEK
jgi:hypothetical protein